MNAVRPLRQLCQPVQRRQPVLQCMVWYPGVGWCRPGRGTRGMGPGCLVSLFYRVFGCITGFSNPGFGLIRVLSPVQWSGPVVCLVVPKVVFFQRSIFDQKPGFVLDSFDRKTVGVRPKTVVSAEMSEMSKISGFLGSKKWSNSTLF